MCTARAAWKSVTLQKLGYKDRMHQIQMDSMHSILHLDEERRRVRVEPMITIGQLNNILIERGWTLPVVPELDDLTIGGLVMGGGIETTSHKYGLFQYTCKSYELVVSDGSVVECNQDNEPELYMAIPFSYGTLGFLTAVTLDIVPYKPYLRLTYQPVYSLNQLTEEFASACHDPDADSVEGLMFTADTGVIMRGRFTSGCERAKLNRLGRWYKPWFYTPARTFLEKGPAVEYIPTVEFFHRHNRSGFWLLEIVFPFANHWLFRYPLGWTMPPKFSFVKALRGMVDNYANTNFVCQDFGYRLDELNEVLPYVDRKTKVYPLWLCPTRHVVPPELKHLAQFDTESVIVDVGIYGYSPIPGFNYVATQREMERHALDRKDFVALYAETQLTRDDFLERFDMSKDNYDNIRKKFDCEKAFPHVYDKVSKAARG